MNKQEAINGEKGLILNFSSAASFAGQRGHVAYAATKAAINGFTLPMARDLGRLGIRVVSIIPGLISTRLASFIPEDNLKILKKDIPLGRLGTPAEVAHFVGACIENSYLNGVTLRVDGGLLLSNL